jgi:aminopeptidase N
LTSAAFNDQEPDARRTVQSYVRTAARGEAAPMMTHGDYYPGGGRGGYSFASYGKCAAILAQLRDLVGDDVFFGTFRKYASDWAFKHPYPQDFFNAFSTGAGRNLDWFFREWFFDTWTLDQAIDSVTENDGATEVVVSDQRYATYPTVVEVTYDSGETERKTIDVAHWLSGKKTKTVKFGPNVRKVELNPGKVTLDLSARNDVWERK